MTLIAQPSGTTVAVNDDLLINSVHRLSSEDREISGAGYQNAGTGYPGIVFVDLFASDVLIGRFYAQSAVSGVQTLFPVDAFLPSGTELRGIVGGTIPGSQIGGVLYIQIDEVEEGDESMAIEAAMAGL